MSEIATVASVVAAVAGVVGLFLGWYQLRFKAWLKAQELFVDKDFVRARTAVFAHFDDRPKPYPDPSNADAQVVCRKMDEFAHLVRFVGRRKVFLGWGDAIAAV